MVNCSITIEAEIANEADTTPEEGTLDKKADHDMSLAVL